MLVLESPKARLTFLVAYPLSMQPSNADFISDLSKKKTISVGVDRVEKAAKFVSDAPAHL